MVLMLDNIVIPIFKYGVVHEALVTVEIII